MRIFSPIKSLSIKYNIRTSNVIYLTRLIEKHGFDILRTSKNQIYTKEFKREAIDRVILNNEPVWTVAIDIGLCGDGMLHSWIKKYKENGYNIVERKRGRSTMPKVTKKKENETDKEFKKILNHSQKQIFRYLFQLHNSSCPFHLVRQD